MDSQGGQGAVDRGPWTTALADLVEVSEIEDLGRKPVAAAGPGGAAANAPQDAAGAMEGVR
jgi:hypothetical protein